MKVVQLFSRLILTIFGWKLQSNIPNHAKYIIIGAPHTSNWDFPLTLLTLSSLGLRFSWVAKHTLFTGPAGSILKSIGGIPVNRKSRVGFVGAMVENYHNRDKLIIAIAPEGTRSKTDHWKGGFYQIATQANVPLSLGFIDYKTKTLGLGKTLPLTGNVANDFSAIKDFYKNVEGKYPGQQSDICLREKEIKLLNKTMSVKKENLI